MFRNCRSNLLFVLLVDEEVDATPHFLDASIVKYRKIVHQQQYAKVVLYIELLGAIIQHSQQILTYPIKLPSINSPLVSCRHVHLLLGSAVRPGGAGRS